MQNNMKKDYLWNTLGAFLQNAISPLLLIAVTRINGIYDSGIFSFAFSIAVIFWAVSMWGGRTYQVSDVKNEFSHKSYIMVRLVLALIVLVAAYAFSIVNNYDTLKTSIIMALVLLKVIESIADSIYGILQVNNKLFIAGKSLLYKSTVGFAVFVMVDAITKNIFLSSVGLVIINILFVLFYDLRIAGKLENIIIKPARIKKYTIDSITIMRRCAPVFAVIFLSMFPLNIPRYFIDIYHQEQIGYFGIITMPVTLTVLMVTFILQPNVLNLSKLYENKEFNKFNHIVKRLLRITLLVGAAILFITIVLGTKILNFIFDLDFDPYLLSLVILTMGSMANATVAVFIVILTIMRSLKPQFYILASTNLLLIPVSVLFIPKYGLLGGVSLFLGVSILQAGLLFMVYKKYLKRNI